MLFIANSCLLLLMLCEGRHSAGTSTSEPDKAVHVQHEVKCTALADVLSQYITQTAQLIRYQGELVGQSVSSSSSCGYL